MSESQIRRPELRGALVGGLVAALLLYVMIILVGRIGSFEALRLIEAMVPGARFLGSTVVAAGITVLALLLTLVGLSLTSDYEFDPRFFDMARNITTLSVVTLVTGVALLLAVSFPIGEVDQIRPFYVVMYYILVGMMAGVGGLVVSTGLLIGTTLRGLIAIGHPHSHADLLASAALETED